MSAYPFASSVKVEETLDVLGTRNIATTQQTLLQQILVASAANNTQGPSTPTGFTATAGNQQIVLTWTAQPEATSFTIKYSTTNNIGSATVLTSSATGTSFTFDSGESIQAGEKYYFWIKATNGSGTSAYSSSVTARSFVIVTDGAIASLTTPTGSWILSTLFFRTGGNLPLNCTVAWDSGAKAGVSLGDGTWEDLIDGGIFDPPISGDFDFTNSSGSTVTFWNTEP